MSLIQINLDPSQRQLKQFALLSAVMFPGLAWLWGGGVNTVLTCGIIGAALAVFSFVLPQVVKPVFVGLSLLLTPIGLVLGEVFMFLAYYSTFLPIGLCFKLIGRDRLQRKIDRSCETYWMDKKTPTSPERYFQQY